MKFIGSLDTNPNTAASHTVDHEAKSLYDDDISYLCEHEMTRFQIGLEEEGRVDFVCVCKMHFYETHLQS